ncbi:snaclec agglucetin subunit alpha-2-like [Hemibagrus wyckioides]|uniref:snaclec agglucetin subunit alpha-2-like n=1 Tax=Hemibagrus wyckioides TaxID=337641 RepID=UPI00266BF8F8|nr:snaclec agglucetin subunit alpha-2-like [Hemibagrus wyckioides]
MKSIFFIFLLAVGCGVTVGLIREYIFKSTLLDWLHAQSYCRKNYRDLATVTSLVENKLLLQSGSSAYGSWIGLYRNSSIWTWSDGEPLTFPNWFGYLSFLGIFQYDCVVTSSNYGFVPNYNCANKRSFYCYRFLILVKEKKTWEEAQEFCRTNYTGLVSVTSESSLQQLINGTVEMETESVWTGLRFVNGKWFWVSGEQLGSLVSMPSCPVQSYSCGALNTMTNTLNNQNCNERLNFICYWK